MSAKIFQLTEKGFRVLCASPYNPRPIAYVDGRYIFAKKFAVRATRHPV